MPLFAPIALDRLATRLVFVSLGCALLFVLERFVYNVFDVGWEVRHSYLAWAALTLLPCLGYWIALLRSPLIGARGKTFRCVVLLPVAFVLSVGFFYASVMVFWTVAKWTGTRWW